MPAGSAVGGAGWPSSAATRFRRHDGHFERPGLRIELARHHITPHLSAEPSAEMQVVLEFADAGDFRSFFRNVNFQAGELIDHLRVARAAIECVDVGVDLGELSFELIDLFAEDGVDPQRFGGEHEVTHCRQEDEHQQGHMGPVPVTRSEIRRHQRRDEEHQDDNPNDQATTRVGRLCAAGGSAAERMPPSDRKNWAGWTISMINTAPPPVKQFGPPAAAITRCFSTVCRAWRRPRRHDRCDRRREEP